MTMTYAGEYCSICKCGRTARSEQNLSFYQKTIKGYINCSVTVVMDVCRWCGARIWDHATELMIDKAVRRELDKLPVASWRESRITPGG
jgi:hypothetical protein